ncbi:hypothetical protein EJ03DRAFT_31931 [Teratosphaeria nubilosa]|uniref:Uncharacterized protein n=1 Tax=Teratosphaeria nubilosa TaxID=161662 RepID=A0A6G1LG41_9PEZI|nr:hypothetical protein EJ03DRAFT_31931 [Teratosphaeria nubilosa]
MNLKAWKMDINANPQKKRKLSPSSGKLQSYKKRKHPHGQVPGQSPTEHTRTTCPRSKDIRQDSMGFISSRATLRKTRRTPEAARTKQQRPPRFPEKGTYYTHRNNGTNWKGRKRYIMKFRIIEWNRPATDPVVEQGLVSPRTKCGAMKPWKRLLGHWELMVVVN